MNTINSTNTKNSVTETPALLIIDMVKDNFKTVILEDCSTAFSHELHEQTLDIYRRNPLYPLFRIMTSSELMNELNPGIS